MKEKDTNKYRDTVENYCLYRQGVENKEEKIKEYEESVKQAKDKFNEICDTCGEEVKKWYVNYIMLFSGNNEMTSILLEEDKNYMDQYGRILERDYGDNLDDLYKEWCDDEDEELC